MMTDLKAEDRELFEQLGEGKVRAEIACGGDHAFAGNGDKRKAASEWLAEREHQLSRSRATPLKPTIVGPVIGAIAVIGLFLFVAAL